MDNDVAQFVSGKGTNFCRQHQAKVSRTIARESPYLERRGELSKANDHSEEDWLTRNDYNERCK